MAEPPVPQQKRMAGLLSHLRQPLEAITELLRRTKRTPGWFIRPLRWLSEPSRLLRLITVGLLLPVVTCLAGTVYLLHIDLAPGDRIAALGTLFAGGALLIAAFAGIVAAAAYALASGRPSLKVAVLTPDTQNPEPWLYHPEEPGPLVSIQMRVRLYNESQYSARNPAVRVSVFGLDIEVYDSTSFFTTTRPESRNGWIRTEVDYGSGIMTWVWMGGIDATIHGPHWFVETPLLDLSDANWDRSDGAEHGFWLEAVAEGTKVAAQYNLDVGAWVSGEANTVDPY